MQYPRILCLMAAAALVAVPAMAEATQVDVRVIAKGAKFIGTSMGGAEVFIRDAVSGELLAHGTTKGSTGDTELIMEEEALPHAPVSTEDAAVYSTQLDLQAPRQIEVEARAPLAQPQAINTVSMTQWVVPGKHLTGGDAVLLEMPGLIVDVLAPPAHVKLKEPQEVELKANVMMMCGCGIKPDGTWDAADYEVTALVQRDGEELESVELEYAGQTSQFEAVVDADEPGTYSVTVYAYQPDNGNTGLDIATFIIKDEE